MHYGSGEPVRIRSIAATHGIPSRFLVQILLQLKSAGLLSSTRGAAGGYQLIRKPDEVTLADVMQVIDGPLAELSSSTAVESATSRTLLSAWQQVAEAERDLLASVTFADLVERVTTRRAERPS